MTCINMYGRRHAHVSNTSRLEWGYSYAQARTTTLHVYTHGFMHSYNVRISSTRLIAQTAWIWWELSWGACKCMC